MSPGPRVLVLIVVMLFGSKRLKGLGADLGGAIKGFRNSVGGDAQTAVDDGTAAPLVGEARKLEEPAKRG